MHFYIKTILYAFLEQMSFQYVSAVSPNLFLY